MAAPIVEQSVWLSDLKEGWIPATVKEIDNHSGNVRIKLQSGEELMLPRSSYDGFHGSSPTSVNNNNSSSPRRKSQLSRRQTFTRSREKKILPRETGGSYGREGYDDMDNLPYLHEASVLNNLKHRFQMNLIYTSTGPILIAMNPFKWLDIYGDRVVKKYREAVHLDKVPSHCYRVAERAYRDIFNGEKNRSIIICGESGAGKTETTKLMLHYFSLLADENQFDGSVEKRIMDSNPLLEAFGNAKTVRNNNSSRFGKFISLHFDIEEKKLRSGSVINYLLEKSRSVIQPELERNFHIFYQLCQGADDDIRTTLKLQPATSYDYLNQSGCLEVDSISDEEEFQSTRMAMKTLGLTLSQQLAIFKLISAHLHLGNIVFEEDNITNSDGDNVTSSRIDQAQPLERAAEMYGVDASELYEALVTRVIIPPDGNPVIKHLDPEQAVYARNAFAKYVYSGLFAWLVERVNRSLENSKEPLNYDKVKSIGILDIYGFESLLNNGFEQLLINYANETLQTIFNRVIFEGEKSLYSAEGINWDATDFPDNSKCLDLIEHRSNGILALLNEECLLGHGTDLTFCRKITNLFTSTRDPYFAACGPSTKWRDPSSGEPTTEMHFVVRHFAGNIIYTSEFFIEKNRDTVSQRLKNLSKDSTNSIFHSLSTIQDNAISSGSGGRKNRGNKKGRDKGGRKGHNELHSTLGMSFRKQLKSMVEVIKGTKPVFLRCIKSNNYLREQLCDSVSVLRQLRCNGVLAALDMRRAGFPTRILYKEFCERYHVLVKSNQDSERRRSSGSIGRSYKKNWKKVAESILSNEIVEAADIKGSTRLGITRIFFRSGVLAILDTVKETAMRARIIHLQAFFRGRVARTRFAQTVASVMVCQRLLRGYLARREMKDQLRTARRRAQFNVMANKVTAAQEELENIDLVAKESVVHNIQAVAKCATQAQNLLDRVKQSLYNEKGGKVSSDGVHVKGDLESATESIQMYSKVVREHVDRRAQINDARKNVREQLVEVKNKCDDMSTMYEALTDINNSNVKVSDATSSSVSSAFKSIKACEGILTTDNTASFFSALQTATNAVNDASNQVETERQRINKVSNERAAALTSLSDLVDNFSKGMSIADENSLWSSAHVQSVMDDAQRSINDVEIVINKSEDVDTYRGLLKDLAEKISNANSVVISEDNRKKKIEKEMAIAEENLQSCTRRLYNIQESANASGISDIYTVKSAKQVAENAIATARRCSVSSSTSAFISAVKVADVEIAKAEDICKTEKEKKYKLDKDRQNGQSHLEPSMEKFSTICALVKVNNLSTVLEIDDCINVAERAINVAVQAIESGTASEIHSAVANAVTHVDAAEAEVSRVQDAMAHLEEQRKKALEMLEPYIDELNIVRATVEVSNLGDAPHVTNALQAATKAVEDAESVLKEKDISFLDRFNNAVSLAIEEVKTVSSVMKEEKEGRDKWTREKRRLWKALEPLVDECSNIDAIITDGGMQHIDPIEDGISSAHKSIDYVRQILRSGRSDNAVIASTAIDDVSSKLAKVRALITVEEKRKEEEERVLLEANQKLDPVKERLAQAIGSIEVNTLHEVDMVKEALEMAKLAVNSAQHTIQVNTIAASALAAVSIAKEKTDELDEVVRLELQRLSKAKSDLKKAMQTLSDLKQMLSNAEIRAQVGDVETEESVVNAKKHAKATLKKATDFFLADVNDDMDDEYTSSFKVVRSSDHYRDLIRESSLAVTSYETLVTQEVQSKKEAQRLTRQRKMEERRKEEVEAKELRKREEDSAKLREKAALMLDPATAQLANIQGLIELQGISNVPVIQERLKTAKRAVANAQTQLLSGDPTLAITATQATKQMVDHLEETVKHVKVEKSKYMMNKRKKQLHYARLLGALQTFDDCERYLEKNEVNDEDVVRVAMRTAKEALEKAQDSCKMENFEFSLGFEDVSEYIPVELVDANVKSALSLTELAKKTAHREAKIAIEKGILESKIVKDKRYMEDALSKFDYAMQKLSALKACSQIKIVQDIFADKHVVIDALQSAEAAIQSAEMKLSDSHDEPAAIYASVVFAVEKVNDASRAIDREETRLVVKNRRDYEKAKKANDHLNNNRGDLLAYIKESKSTKQLFRNLSFKNNRTNKIKRINFPIKRNNYTSKSSPSSRRLMSTDDDVSEEELEDGYFTTRRDNLAKTNIAINNRNSNNGKKQKRKDSYHLKLTPAMIRLLPKHARMKLLESKNNEEKNKAEEQKNNDEINNNDNSHKQDSDTTTIHDLAESSSMSDIEKRLKSISEKNKNIQVDSNNNKRNKRNDVMNFDNSVEARTPISDTSFQKVNVTKEYNRSDNRNNQQDGPAKKDNSTPLIPPPEAMSMEDSTTTIEEMGTNDAYDDNYIGNDFDDVSGQIRQNSTAVNSNGTFIPPPPPPPIATDDNEIENFDEVAKDRLLEIIAGVIHKQKGLFGRLIENVRVAFRRYDRKGDGLIYSSQFEQAIENLDLRLNKNQKKSLIRAMNRRDDGRIEYESLLRALKLKRSNLLRGMSNEERNYKFGKREIPRTRKTKFKPPYQKRNINDWNNTIREKLKRNKVAGSARETERGRRLAQRAKEMSYKKF